MTEGSAVPSAEVTDVRATVAGPDGSTSSGAGGLPFSALDLLPAPALLLDARGRVEYANQALLEAAGATRDVFGRRPGFLRGATDRVVRNSMREAVASGHPWSGAVDVGERRFQVTATPMVGPCSGTEAALVLVVAREVSREMELERRLRRAQRLESMGRLASGMVHDINNILTVIEATATFAQRAAEDRPDLKEDLTEIRDAVRSAAVLSRQILSFSRREDEGDTPVDLNQFVRRVSKLFERLVSENITLEMNLGRDLPTVTADESQLEQIVANLVVNARDAMPPAGGRIVLSTGQRRVAASDIPPGFETAAPGPHLVLGVRDTGMGMDDETLRRVFEPFFTTKAPERGTGLGLATVRGLVERNRAFLTVASAPGIGTEFLVYLPVRVEGPVNPAPPAVSPTSSDPAIGS
jgi:signal transduction histidine kinase